MLSVLLKVLQFLPPEKAHRLTIRCLQLAACTPYLSANKRAVPVLDAERMNEQDKVTDVSKVQGGQGGKGKHWSCLGLRFRHPIGVAAGFDKDAEAFAGLWRFGFAFVEVGTVTPLPQFGNATPRLFRLLEDKAVINRMGFNNRGIEAMAQRLAKEKTRRGILGINVGPNKDATDPLADYQCSMLKLAAFADYFAINVSSPNTPGLRTLQQGNMLIKLLHRVQQTRHQLKEMYALMPPVLIKIAPDWQDEEDFYRLLDAAVEHGIDGVIISNTTLQRPNNLRNHHKIEDGGLSGVPLFVSSTALLARAYKHVQGAIPLIGVGGVTDQMSAILKMKAGASLVQIYSGLVYNGTEILNRSNKNTLKVHNIDNLDTGSFQWDISMIGSMSEAFSCQENIKSTLLSRNENNYT